ncbi:MAG TPA: nucleotidyltransferase domain-containing protein [Lachnospiraceae bacterium]|nr:nucleotidyltransferase domain-containing protein [Lachnospiraceae bacterium]
MTQKEKHSQALKSFTEKVKNDPNVIALVLSGSLAYGTVWKRSDIDLTMLVRDGINAKFSLYNIDEGGVEIHMIIMPVGMFKKEMRQFRAGQFTHGYYGKGEIVFSKDDSLYLIFEENRTVGMDDVTMSIIPNVQMLLVNMYRVEKWITAFHDPLYSQHFLQDCAASVADIILLMNKEEPTRESILRAMELRPELMQKIHVIPCTTAMTEDEVRDTLKLLDDFILETMDLWSTPILRFFSDGELKTSSEFEHFVGSDVVFCLNYLAEHGLLERVTKASRVFKHSVLTVEEIAYVAINP